MRLTNEHAIFELDPSTVTHQKCKNCSGDAEYRSRYQVSFAWGISYTDGEYLCAEHARKYCIKYNLDIPVFRLFESVYQ